MSSTAKLLNAEVFWNMQTPSIGAARPLSGPASYPAVEGGHRHFDSSRRRGRPDLFRLFETGAQEREPTWVARR
jgi:hypothetical protein